MTPTLFSLIAVTVGFTALVVWVYWPGRRERYRRYGRIPFKDNDQVSHKDQVNDNDQEPRA